VPRRALCSKDFLRASESGETRGFAVEASSLNQLLFRQGNALKGARFDRACGVRSVWERLAKNACNRDKEERRANG